MTGRGFDGVVRDAVAGDLTAITAIYAEGVLIGTGTFELSPPDESEMSRRMAAVAEVGMPWLVAEIDGGVVGYAYVGPFRTRSAYRYTVEDSIYILASAQGRGVGRALLDELIVRCEAAGIRQILAVIGDAANEGSIRLHAACGFEPAGAIKDVGWKFDRWLDVIFMQKTLGVGGDGAPYGPGMPLKG